MAKPGLTRQGPFIPYHPTASKFSFIIAKQTSYRSYKHIIEPGILSLFPYALLRLAGPCWAPMTMQNVFRGVFGQVLLWMSPAVQQIHHGRGYMA